MMLNWQIGENDGIELAGKINALRPEARIVFMSDNLERIKDIFHVSPFYFLLKPIEKDYLQCCRTRYLSKLDNLFVKSFRSTRIAKLHDFIQKKALAAKIATRAFGL